MLVMQTKGYLVVLCVLITINKSQVAASEDGVHVKPTLKKTCPIWTELQPNGTCQCGSDLGGRINCDNATKKVRLMACFCIDNSIEINYTVVRTCLYTCNTPEWYFNVPGNLSEARQLICHPYNREGFMCNSCKANYSLPANSYSIGCVKCSYHGYNWLIYIASTFLPIISFYIILVAFRINATSGKMLSYVLVSQVAACPSHMRGLSAYMYVGSENHNIVWFMKTISTLYGIWNLDFGRVLHEPTCLHPSMTMLQIIALDYAVALFPLCLILTTYVFVKLHDKYAIVVKLWKPFYWCFSKIRKEWNIKMSLIEVFATSLLLSYVKLINVSIDLLPNCVSFTMNGWQPRTYFYDPDVLYFGVKDLPYVICAISLLALFVLLPLLLVCLYPCRYFQKFLNCCNLRCTTLHTFMDVFLCPYKTQPRDCRCFAGVYLVLRIVILSVFYQQVGRFYTATAAFCFLFTGLLVVIVRPYKSERYNTLDAIFLFLSAYVCFVYSMTLHSPISNAYTKATLITCLAAMALPPLYGMALVVHGLGKWQRLVVIKQFCQDRMKQDYTESPPYRLEHSEEYPPLLL